MSEHLPLPGRSSSVSREVEDSRPQDVTGIPTTLGDRIRQELDIPRFLCDTSPLVALQNDPQPPQPRLLRSQSCQGGVGAWSYEEGVTSYQEGVASRQHAPQRADIPQRGGYSGLLPPKECQIALVEIFFSRIYPLLPLVDEEDTRHQFNNDSLPLPLLQAICLVAAKDRAAASFLFLGSDPTLLPLKEFGPRLQKDIPQNMPNRRDGNRVLIIRILAILSLHEWGPNGSEDASLSLAQAVHHAQSIGLHLRGPDSESSLKAKSLFWCLWSLDKWNSVVDGRPVLIHDYDHGQKVTDVLPLFKPQFRIWLLIADQLGRVISTYRPRLEGARDQVADLYTFEEFVETSEAWDIEPQLLDSLELYHHATIILGTYSTELQGRQPSRASNIHQSQAILALAAICRRKDVNDFSPMPVSAYSLSLAFSITYRQLQRAKLQGHRVQARENLLTFHQSLKSLCSTWWLAAVMVRLGKHALESYRPAINTQSESQIPTDSLEEGLRTRPPLIQGTNLVSNVNYSTPHTQTNSDSVDNLNTPQDNLDTPEDMVTGAPFSSDLDLLFGSHDLSGSFETFFENFLDVNFPTCLGEQSLGCYDALI
ncbi:hypothetical protein N7533_003646 [Penicillium manginii]|uniref:uncharacterized protein n=1 Tax=Penicillium manginii TaxID=203109 RepID=UPI002546C340|nr:uncharacterized protein N7533_003646 [Penicillium manginii]KAJ5761607.1 hypothetical protein N7533_003646 [Penicillium manginii]